jgi:hypothetical protein
MTFNQFTAYFAANQKFIPAALRSEIRRAAVSRVKERLQDGYADCALDFSDLTLKMETAVAS